MSWDAFRVEDESEAALVQEIVGEDKVDCKKGRAAEHEYGVTYQGPWETYRDGVNIAVRRHAVALQKSGLPVFLQSQSFTHSNMGVTTTVEYHRLPKVILAEVGSMTEPKHGDTSVLIRHTLPSLGILESIAYPKGMHFMTPEGLALHRGRTVLFSAFEENVVSEEKVKCMNLLGQIWVTSTASAQWLVDSGVDRSKVRIIPHPFYGKDPIANIATRPKGPVFRFLHISKWEPRKAQHTLIGGFLTAFRPEQQIELVLKLFPFCRAEDYPEDPMDSIRQWLEDDGVKRQGWSLENVMRKVRILWKKEMDRKQLSRLYAECDAYVSSGRSEGFDLSAFDAKLAGLRVVHADSGGPDDFCTPDDVLIGSSERELFHPWYDFGASTWHAYGVSDMASALFIAYERRNEPIPSFDRSPFTLTAVGAKMRQACEDLAPELKDVGR